jgi:hypothetical protein
MMASIDRYRLLFGAYSPSTVKKYLPALLRFVKWCSSYGINVSSPSLLDRVLSEYMLELYLAGYSKVEASCAMYALDMLVPGIGTQLVWSRRSLRGYGRLYVSVQHPPLTAPAVACIACWLVIKGKLPMAIGVMLSFDCYLRSSELLGLVREDVAISSDPRLGMVGDRMYLRLGHTKTGANKGVEVRDLHIKALVSMLVDRATPSSKLFAFSYSSYLKWFHLACADLGLSERYVPHSLRHSGATYDFLRDMHISDIMVRGRWAVHKSAAHYIQVGRQLLMAQHVPIEVDKMGRCILGSMLPVFMGCHLMAGGRL